MADRLEPHQAEGQPHHKVRLRHPPRQQPARAERLASLRAAHFSPNRTIGPNGGGLGVASFLLGDVSSFGRFVSTSTDAKEAQWRQFYYLQDTWRATSKLTLNIGLRADIFNPQTVNEPGNGGWLDITTGQIQVGGVGDINLAGNVENTVNWAPRVGAAYQINEKTVIRAGYGRSYDIGVFGSTFGHAVTQNLPVLSFQNINPPNNYDAVFNLAPGPPPPTFRTPAPDGHFALPNGVSARLLPADRCMCPCLGLERDRPAAAHDDDVGRDRLRRQPQQPGLHRQRPGRQLQRPDPGRLRHAQHRTSGGPSSPADPGRANARKVTPGISVAPSAGPRASTTSAARARADYNALQAKLTRRFANG